MMSLFLHNRGIFLKSVLELVKIRVFLKSKLSLFQRKIGDNFSKIDLESAQNRVFFEISEYACVTPLYTG